MPVAKRSNFRCPECGGFLHVESYIGNQSKGKYGYNQLYCIGGPDEYDHLEEDQIPGMDGVSFKNKGCGFSAKRRFVPSTLDNNNADNFEEDPGTVVRKDEGYDQAKVEEDN